jgi:hypothetical protein
MEYCHVMLSSPLVLHIYIYRILEELPDFYETLHGNGAV